MHVCPDKKCMDLVLTLDITISKLTFELHIKVSQKDGIKIPKYSESVLSQNGVLIVLHY